MTNRNSTSDDDRPSERSFGLVFAVFFAVIASLPLLHGGSVRIWAVVAAALFLTAAFVAPRLLAPLNLVWFYFGKLLHHITSPILLGLVFYLSVTPIGLLLRVFGKDVLALKKRPDLPSYWIEREPGPPPDTLRNQF
jgi:Saxitoxin biosynthesis operon protein SxtJ